MTPPDATSTETPGLTGENALLAREAKLGAEQQKRLAETTAEGTKAMTEWQERNRDKIASFQQAVQAAQLAQDRQAFEKAVGDHQSLLRERMALQAKFSQRIMDILTPKQEGTWFGFILSRNLTDQAQTANLTDEQKTKTRTLCDEAAGKLAALRRSEKADQEKATESQTIQQGLVRAFLNDVLTDTQRATVQGGAPGAAPPMAPATGPAVEPETGPPAGGR